MSIQLLFFFFSQSTVCGGSESFSRSQANVLCNLHYASLLWLQISGPVSATASSQHDSDAISKTPTAHLRRVQVSSRAASLRLQVTPWFATTKDTFGASLGAQMETQVGSLGWKDPLEEGMATHSRILAWRIPRTQEPGGLQCTG